MLASIQMISAQCPAGSKSNTAGTYNNGDIVCISANFNGNIILNNGAKMVIVSGGNYTGSINANNGSVIEVKSGGIFNPGNANNFATTLTVEKNGTVQMAGNFGLSPGFTLNNNGSFTWSRSWNQNNNVTVTNGACGTMLFAQNTNLTHDAALNNNGTMTIQGELNTERGTTVNNRGRLTVTGNFNLSGSFYNQFQALLLGNNSNLNNVNDSLVNLHTMYFGGTLSGSVRFRNEGLVWIKGNFYYNGGNLALNRPTSQIRVEGGMNNDGTLRGIGSVSVAGTFRGNGTFAGLNSNERLTLSKTPENGSKTNVQVNPYLQLLDTAGYTGGLANPDICTNSLPMEVSPLQAVYQKGAVELDWYTVTELNSKEFVVEYSTDGVNFQADGTIAANGNSNSRINYSYRFTKINGATMYFRLLLVDLDGSTDYSATVVVRISGAQQQLSAQAYPNPFTERLDISLTLSRKSEVDVKLFDMNGRVVRNQVFSGQNGSNRLTLNALSDLRSGIYILSITAGEEKWMQKVIR